MKSYRLIGWYLHTLNGDCIALMNQLIFSKDTRLWKNSKKNKDFLTSFRMCGILLSVDGVARY